VERTHCTTFEHQWTIVLMAIYTATFSEYFLAIKALRKHFLSYRQLSNIITINLCKYLIHLLLHLSDLILLSLNYLTVLPHYLLQRSNAVVLVLHHDWAWDTSQAALWARYGQFFAFREVREPIRAGERGFAPANSADYWDL
jgi:hypothetical protein